MRLFCRAKSNIGPDDGGFEYDLHQAELKTHPGIFASSVAWGEAVEGAARELLATADATGDDGEGGTLGEAKRFLADLLTDGPSTVKAIKADADGAGYSWATIRRARSGCRRRLRPAPRSPGGTHAGSTLASFRPQTRSPFPRTAPSPISGHGRESPVSPTTTSGRRTRT